jgi:hypothetical protein
MHLMLALLLAGKWAAIVLPADKGDDELAQNLSDVLVATIADRTHSELVGREEFRTQLGLSDRGVLGCAGDTACLGRVGVQLKVDKMVVGTVSRGVGDEYIVNLNLIDVGALRAEQGVLRKTHGVQALVQEVQGIAVQFTGGRPLVTTPESKGAPEVTPPAPTGEQVPIGETNLVGVRERPARFRTMAWTLTIGGASSVLIGVILGSAAHSKANDLEHQSNIMPPQLFDNSLQKLQTDGKNLDDAAKFFGAVGLIAAGTGLILFYVGRPITVTTDGRTVSLAGRF